MSSHDMSIRTLNPLPLREGVGLAQVLQAFDGFLRLHGITELKPIQGVENGREGVEDPEMSCEIEVGPSGLDFSLDCSGGGHGDNPDGFDDLYEALVPLLASHGIVEIIDHDISAANATAVVQSLLVPSNEADISPSRARNLVGVARMRTILHEMDLAPGQQALFEQVFDACSKKSPDAGGTLYTERDALHELLDGLFAIGFCADVSISGADAVQSICELVDDMRSRQLPKLGIKYFKIHSEKENGFWSNQLGWVEADLATLYTTKPQVLPLQDQRVIPVALEKTFGVEPIEMDGMTLEAAIELAQSLDEGVQSVRAASLALETECEETTEPSQPLLQARALISAALQQQAKATV